MNTKTPRQALTTPLAHTTLTALISDLLCDYEIHHTFRNDGPNAVELVYSFPMPLDAVFLSMDATLAGETLSATVLPARQANQNYDQAIGEGHSAVLLEQLQPGLLCVNLGNLKPGEQGEIVLRFVAALNVADARARFSLPLVHRPRYGRSILDEITTPHNDFAVEHPLEASIRVRGMLAACPVGCATPGVRFAMESGELVLKIAKAQLDRDLVLSFELGAHMPPQARHIADGAGSLGMVTFTLPYAASAEVAPRDICLLLDCSGSMQGDAIVQSRAALAAVTEALHEQDRIQVIRFGSTTSALFRRPLQASSRIKAALRELQTTVNANLGGTEMDAALKEAMQALAQIEGPTERKVIILVTDGAVNAHELVRAKAQAINQGVRIFVVAVGSSAGVDALAPLAEATHACLERAVPAEPIDAGVMRQFRRARTQALQLGVRWSDGAKALPAGRVYPGDAASLIAHFDTQQAISAAVSLGAGEQAINFQFAELESSPTWRAWAGYQLYLQAAPNSSEREALALNYGLITQETKAVLVKQRAEGERIGGLPVVTPVSHMLPAGMLAACPAPPSAAPVYAGSPHRSMSKSAPAGAPQADMSLDCMVYFSSAEGSAMPEELAPEIKLALARALRDLLLRGNRATVTLTELLQQLEPQWHEQVRSYWLACGSEHINRSVALTRLLALLDEVTLELSDDDEAQIAVLSHS